MFYLSENYSKMKRILWLGALIPVLFIIQSCQSSKSATTSKMLKFNFEPGKSYVYDMISDFDQEVGGQKQQFSMTAQYGLDVKAANNGVTDIVTKFNAIKLTMQVAGFTVEADTEKPLKSDTTGELNPADMMNRMFHAIKGQTFNMKVDAEGKVLEVTGMEEMANKMIESMGMGEEFASTLRQTFQEQFNDARMKEQFERAFFIFPGKEVKVGESWVKEHNMPGQETGSFKTTYTVESIEGDIVHLDVNSVFGGDEKSAKMSGTQKGNMSVDARTGLIMESDLDMDIAAEEEGQKFSMVGKIKIRGRENK
jgi:hypothetical protein